MSMTRLQHVRGLYKIILRLHRGLPNDIKLLGDNYVKIEFRQHKNCNDYEANQFLNEWTDYACNLSKQMHVKNTMENSDDKLGENINTQLINTMSDDQVVQLYELLKAAKYQEKS